MILRIAWAVMSRQEEDYRQDGGDLHDRREARRGQHLAERYQKTLEHLGYRVTLISPGPDPTGVADLTHPKEPAG
ncbi:hypothetical protein Acor_69580 [Acrocarpospora corrugata]|uniref:Uncharacterized protein n=1 Tax=Acrocarpospora corrugata TaxID=35763 RepID=A0A5M3W9H9_9ACTN|nr:hypothetical protein [Acrocarpospora corrugata]GES04890.1 hypothetical protein Acor_69580 [Acrocarpospora corrugata]